MASAIHGVLQAMDNLANVPVSLTARLLQPAPPRHRTQSASDLTPPRVVRRKRRLTLPLPLPLPLEDPASASPEKKKWFGKVVPQRAVEQRTLQQGQSRLVRLPAELREQIWRFVVLGDAEAGGREEEGVIALYWRSTSSGRGRASAFQVHQRRLGVMGMLCSCRIIYSEAISLLYSVPTFAFQHQNLETFLAFVCAIPRLRVDQIRYLDLRWLGLRKSTESSEEGAQKAEHQADIRWSYWRIGNIKALSQLPDANRAYAERGFVHSDWVVHEIIKSMKGLEKGGVNWGSASTGCFAQERVDLGESVP